MVNKIFFNADLQYLRAGWRIGIFVLIFAVCSVAVAVPFTIMAKYFPGIKSILLQTFLSYAALTAATWIMLRIIDKRPFRSVGLQFGQAWGKELLLGVLMGSGMMTTIVIIMYSSGMMVIEFRPLEVQEVMLIFFNSFFLYVVVGYGEELMFRGYIFQVFCEGTNRIIPVITISLLFALAHANNPNVSLFGLINVGLAGVWLSAAYLKTNALWFPVGLHFSWNFFQGFVYSLPVSGTTSVKEQIGTAIVTGPVWLTGGTFGPEGGALATLMLIVATIMIMTMKVFRPAEGIWIFEQWRDERRSALRNPVSASEGTIVQ